MAQREFIFQPGAVLHAAIMGGFRANGGSLSAWCRENKVMETVARQSTLGMPQEPTGQALLAKIIEAAGENFVRVVYERRLLDHAAQVKRGAA